MSAKQNKRLRKLAAEQTVGFPSAAWAWKNLKKQQVINAPSTARGTYRAMKKKAKRGP